MFKVETAVKKIKKVVIKSNKFFLSRTSCQTVEKFKQKKRRNSCQTINNDFFNMKKSWHNIEKAFKQIETVTKKTNKCFKTSKNVTRSNKFFLKSRTSCQTKRCFKSKKLSTIRQRFLKSRNRCQTNKQVF